MQDMATSIGAQREDMGTPEAADTPLDSESTEEQLPPLNGGMGNHVAVKVNGKACPLVAGARKRKLRGAKIQQMKRPPSESYLSDGPDHISGDEETGMTLQNFSMRIHPDKVHICSTCGKGLSSASSLERHLLVHTGEKPFKCTSCDMSFSTNGNMHRHMRSHIHREKTDDDTDYSETHSPRKKKLLNEEMYYKPSRISQNGGFKDLTFVDFSIGKFPLIAKEFCEHHEAMTAINAFRCSKCNKMFPCESALRIHETGSHQNGDGSSNYCCICESAFITSDELKRHMKRHRSVEDVSGSEDTDVEQRKDDFLGLLDLQHKSDDESDTEKIPNNNNNNASGDFADIQSILTMTSKTAFLMAKSPTAAASSPGSHASSTQPSSPLSAEMIASDDRGEEEDAFAAEFREMKLRGEFPCRLCTAVYPNLRALKGHNRIHLGSAPYRCNMCPFFSNDKSTVIRHMRIHNGDRPFECSICKYAFTTKANCERHLRNRHGKKGREEVRDAIVFHQPEPTSGSENSEIELASPKKETTSNGISNGYQCSLCHLSFNSYSSLARHENTDHPSYDNEDTMTKIKPESMFIESEQKALHEVDVTPVDALVNLTKKHDMTNLKIPTFEKPKVEAPLDLSVNDVLDLSKKKPTQDEPEDLSKKSNGTEPHQHEPMVKRNPPYFQSPPLFYSSPFQSRQVPYYLPVAIGMFNNQPLQLPVPMFPLTLQSLKKEEVPKTEDLKGVASRGLQLSAGGSLLEQLPASSNPIPKQEFPTQPFTLHYSKSNSSTPDTKSPAPTISEDSANMKMVIKNGVLMKKQKQRRYRTERPFACDFCSARFTLRSNMERHIKQQHPDNWSRRPRGTRRSTPVGEYSPQSMHIPDVVISEPHDIIRVPSPKLIPTISEEVRQQLKHKLETPREEVDCGERLVIDEAAPVKEEPVEKKIIKEEVDLASVKRLLDDANTNTQNFQHFFSCSVEQDEKNVPVTVNKIKSEQSEVDKPPKKKSAYSSAPHKVSCPYCLRKFPWTSSLHRHILTHTGQKPFKCPKCSLWFTTKSNRDRHLLRKHRNNSTDSNFNMRNVPERPYKCPQCPSSTFSTLSNLKKHQASRHMDPSQQNGPLSPMTDDDGSEYNNGSSYEMEESEPNGMYPCHKCTQVFTSQSRLAVHIEQHSELPFKCHLCDDSFAERQEALDHIKLSHPDEYDLLVSKGALDTAASAVDELYGNGHHNGENGMDDTYDQIRGKFPDYTNRKVTCAFCMRRFWSAEDLRRHMRTHSGVRPFSCNICQRRFTLKHSMLRHRKKHANGTITNDDSNNGVDNSDDESTKDDSINGEESGNSDCDVPVSTEPTNGILLKKKRDNLTAKINKISAAAAALNKWDKDFGEKLPSTQDTGDLISNLLGFASKDMVDELISKSADDAAKLLGVQNKV